MAIAETASALIGGLSGGNGILGSGGSPMGGDTQVNDFTDSKGIHINFGISPVKDTFEGLQNNQVLIGAIVGVSVLLFLVVKK